MILVCVKPLNIITPIVMAAVSILSILKKYLTNGINFWVKDLVIQSNLRFFALNIRMSVTVVGDNRY